VPELLKAAGYQTAALVANPNIDPAFGFERGFDVYKRLYRMPEILRPPSSLDLIYTAPMMVEEVKQFIASAPTDQPFFLFVLTIDPHGPYTPPPPFDAMYDPRAAGGEMGMMKNLLLLDRQLKSRETASLELPLALYRGEITFGDLAFGQLMSWIAEQPGLDNTAVIVTADHGEAFGEHGNRGHGKTLYENTIHVPLIIRHREYFKPGDRYSENVSLLDLSTTIVALAGASKPDYWAGRDLRRPGPEIPVFAMSHQPGYAFTSVTSGQYKLIQNERDSSLQLFDLKADYQEQSPLDQSQYQTVVDAMLSDLNRFRERSAKIRAATVHGQNQLREDQIPVDIRDQLESLGYIN
jgi:arylsulfatase A-like enzyme